MTSRCRTFRFRLHPTVHQRIALEHQLNYQRELYNAALEERIGAWKWERRSISYIDQCRTLTGLRDVRPEVVTSGITLCRGTLKRLDRAFSGFYRRIKRGETPGFPRFKSVTRWDSLQWEDRNGWKADISSKRLFLLGIGHVKANFHRMPEGTSKAITVKREGMKWWVSIRCVDVPARPLPSTGRAVGIDLGVANLVATSDGEFFVGERFGSRASDRLADAQRSLSSKQRDSNRRRRQREVVARLHRKVAQQRLNQAHQLSRVFVDRFDLIALEDLQVATMVRAPKSKADPKNPGVFLPNGASRKAGLNRSIYDAGWTTLRSLISYKAESAGRTIVAVRPHHTSQTCAECGHVDSGNRVTQAVFHCQRCAHHANADVNAARNILRAGRAQLASASAVSN